MTDLNVISISSKSRSVVRFLCKLLMVFVAVSVCAYVSLNYTRDLGDVAALWPANAIVVAVLMNEYRFRRFVAVIAVALAANILVRLSISHVYELLLGISLANTVEIVICIGFVRFFISEKFNLKNINHLKIFGISAALIAPFVSGTIAASLISLFGPAHFKDSFVVWLFSHALGLSLFTLLFLSIRFQDVRALFVPGRKMRSIAVFLGMLVVLALVFMQDSYPILFLPIAALVIAAFHLEIAGTAVCLLLTTLVAVLATTLHQGPLALMKESLTQQVMVMQLFLAVAGVMILPVAIIVTERQKLQSSLIKAREIADQANRAKSDFLTAMSHELRTPMNSILGFAQLLQMDMNSGLAERERQYVDYILSGGHYLLKLINDVLDLARIEAGKFSIHMNSLPCRDVISSLVTTLRPLADKRNIAIEVMIDPEVNSLEADADRLMQVLINLGSNAIKYNNEGGKVTISATLRHSMVRIGIADTGPGIPQEKQSEIFEPFNRLGAEKGTIEGTGIGLVIAKRLIEAMGGQIGFTSMPGKSTEFWVSLQTGVALFKTEQAFDKQLPVDRTKIQASVLYIEDNATNSFLMRQMLEDFLGISITNARSVKEGLDMAQAFHYDLILTDIHLSDGTGYDILDALRNQYGMNDVPVIALTADATHETAEKMKKAGFDDYYTKPFEIPVVLAGIRALLNK